MFLAARCIKQKNEKYTRSENISNHVHLLENTTETTILRFQFLGTWMTIL